MPTSASARIMMMAKETAKNMMAEPKKMAKNLNKTYMKSAMGKLKTAFVKGWPGKMLRMK